MNEIQGSPHPGTGPAPSETLHRRRVTRWACPGGFTLLELLIASAVLTIGMLSAASLLLVALSSHFNSKLEAAALRMTQSALEELKSLPLNHAGLADSTDSLTPDHEIDFSAPPSPSHARTTMVTLQSLGSTRIEFETRWHVRTSDGRKVITGATRKTGGHSPFRPVNMRIVRLYTAPSLGI
ncbi:MAG: prepilin-type N-terminal cleavage/methylation domain-containing protein [Acidobacteriota bacterium]|nr:prepilin-type N-terminal cleavage/methylation domain-containing protein [Acidobacteriota bacterium]